MGVGLVLSSRLVVAAMATGSPAAKCGHIKVGDRLVSVNGQDVRGMQAPELQPLIMGTDGSMVALGFYSKHDDAETPLPGSFEVTLLRRDCRASNVVTNVTRPEECVKNHTPMGLSSPSKDGDGMPILPFTTSSGTVARVEDDRLAKTSHLLTRLLQPLADISTVGRKMASHR